jgi:hypothetical protein
MIASAVILLVGIGIGAFVVWLACHYDGSPDPPDPRRMNRR